MRSRLFLITLFFLSGVALAAQKQDKPVSPAKHAISLESPASRVGAPSQAVLPGGPAPNFMPSIGSYRTYGYVDMSGVAVEGEVWTFDHGGGDPYEGWKTDDLTENNFTAWKHVTAGSWAGHDNVPKAPVIGGTGSMWLGFYEDEANAECWDAGLGYGNLWRQQIVSPAFNHTGGGAVTVDFDYFHDMDSGFDNMRLIVVYGATKGALATFTGQSGTPAAPTHHNQSFNLGVTAFRFLLEFESDVTFSDEDGSYPTSIGVFGFDDFTVAGTNVVPLGVPPPYQFETDVNGWTALAAPGVGGLADIGDSGAYTILDPTCSIKGNAVSFHNGSMLHPAGQTERFTSPPVPVASYGVLPLNIFAEYDIYADMPEGDDIFWTWGFSYYPVFCAALGGNVWSDVVGSPYQFYHPFPECSRFRSFANDPTAVSDASGAGAILIPAGADFIRFHLEVISKSGSASGNFTPIFDNIRIGVSPKSTILHVPSPTYPTIQSAINDAEGGDTVMVAAGTYTGEGNRDLTFGGKSIVVMSEVGPAGTIIDCEHAGRGIVFASGETPDAVFDGFTIMHGDVNLFGTALRVGPVSSSPTIRNCTFSNNESNSNTNGVVLVDAGAPSFDNCIAVLDTTDGSNGVFTVAGGAPTFSACTVTANQTYGFALLLVGGTPTFSACSITNNSGGTAVWAGAAAFFTKCDISGNSDDGMYFPNGVGPSAVEYSTIIGNGGAGVIIESNSTSFNGCTISGNNASGIVFTGIITAALQAGEIPEGLENLLAVQPPIADATISTTTSFDSCVISGNVNTSASGGGIRFDCTNSPTSTFAPTWTSCTITGNSSSVTGGGVYVCGNAVFADIAPIFTSCTIAANMASGEGGGIHMNVTPAGAVGTVQFNRTIMWQNCAGAGSDTYAATENFVDFGCCIFLDSGIDGSGNIVHSTPNADGNPEFCEEPFCVTEGSVLGDIQVFNSSYAHPDSSPCGQLIGAGGVACSLVTAIVPGEYPAPQKTALLPNVPNPFNPTTTIRFDIAEPVVVMLRIYDVKGRLVRTLVNERLPVAQHFVEWDGRNDRGVSVATGVYFARLTAGQIVESQKMVLLK